MKLQSFSQTTIAIWLATLFTACSDLEPITCPGGLQCSPGWSCPTDPDEPKCIPPKGCGNGTIEPGEECEDGNDTPGDGCNEGCKNEYCGNNIIDIGEVCDDGNTESGDECNATCLSDERCGNGIIDPDETCDDGNERSDDGCSEHCQDEYCGNGIPDPGEACDCGANEDSRINGDSDCTSPNSAYGGYCRTDCALHCGDGQKSKDEECDGRSDSYIFCADFNRGQSQYAMGIITHCNTCKFDPSCECRAIGNQELLPIDLPTPLITERLNAVFGLAPATLFAVTDKGKIVRHNSNQWYVEHEPSQPDHYALTDLWGDGLNLYAVGDKGTILWRDAAVQEEWRLSPTNDPNDDIYFGVWGNAEEVIVVGQSGKILIGSRQSHGDEGIEWQEVLPSPTEEDLKDVWGNGSDVYVVGNAGTILRRTGNAWTSLSPALTNEDLYGIWGNGGDVFAVGDSGSVIHINTRDTIGERMRVESDATVESDAMLVSIWGTSATDILAVSRDGDVFHYDGNSNNIWAPVHLEDRFKSRSIWSEKNGGSEVTSVVVGDSGKAYRFSYDPYQEADCP